MRFHALDGLRGLCALTVAFLHLYHHMMLQPPAFIEHSFALVDFFFVLSGFVLAHAFFNSLAGRGEGVAFALRRIGRLYPLHFFILGLFLVVEIGRYAASLNGATLTSQPFTDATSVASLLSNLALVQALGVHDGITWNFPAWSISVEFWVNILFAAVLVAPLSRRGRDPLREKTRLVLLMALAGGVATFFAARVSKDLTFDYGLLRCIYGFFLGAAAQRLRADNRDPTAKWPPLVLAGAEIALAVAAVVFMIHGDRFWLFMLSPPLFAVITLVFARERGPLSRLLLTRPFHAFGEWSYSIYMVHAFLLVDVMGRAASLAGKAGLFGVPPGLDGGRALAEIFGRGPVEAAGLLLVYVALVLGTSALTYRYIERPGRSWFNALAARKPARASMAPAE